MRIFATIAAAILAFALFAGPAAAKDWGGIDGEFQIATSGGTDKYGGHTPSEKSATKKHPAGVYHCHGTGAKREVCDMRVRVKAQQDKLNRLEIEATARGRELASVLRTNDKLKREVAQYRSAADAQARAARDARKERDAAKTARDSAIRDMREAELRAEGAGPAVSSRCKDGVKAAIDSGWRFSSAEKEALRKACLY